MVLQCVTIDPINCKDWRCLGDWEDETFGEIFTSDNNPLAPLERKFDGQRDPVFPLLLRELKMVADFDDRSCSIYY